MNPLGWPVDSTVLNYQRCIYLKQDHCDLKVLLTTAAPFLDSSE